eukprot:2892183-Prymnesium_polylepis.1
MHVGVLCLLRALPSAVSYPTWGGAQATKNQVGEWANVLPMARLALKAFPLARDRAMGNRAQVTPLA